MTNTQFEILRKVIFWATMVITVSSMAEARGGILILLTIFSLVVLCSYTLIDSNEE